MENQTNPTPEKIDEATLVRIEREKLKAENDALEAEKLRGERLRAESMMAGKTLMTPQQNKSPEEIKKEGAKEFFKGTSIEKAISKYG